MLQLTCSMLTNRERQMMLNFFKRFFKQAPDVVKPIITTKMFFDGDQISGAIGKAIIKPQPNTSYIWVAAGAVATILKSAPITVIKPIGIGKESTDMVIAMQAMKECIENANLKELYIVSSDGDMIEVLITLAAQFKTVKFIQLAPSTYKTSKKALEAIRNLPPTVKFTRFKLKK